MVVDDRNVRGERRQRGAPGKGQRGAVSQGDLAMIGREFRRRLRLLQGRSETITTRFELTDAGRLVEHISLETHDRRTGRLDKRLVPVDRRKESAG